MSETKLQVNTNALVFNAKSIKRSLPSGVRACFVIKSDSYNHGLVEVARAIEADADYFGILDVKEGITLRKAGVTKPLLILSSFSKARLKDLKKHNLSQSVFSVEILKIIDEFSRRKKKDIGLHLKIDTGFNRLGIKQLAELEECLKIFKANKRLKFLGVYSHFSDADNKMSDFGGALVKQYNDFITFKNTIDFYGFENLIYHISNSAATERSIASPLFNLTFDMVRVGILLYGYKRFDESDILVLPALKLTAPVLEVKDVAAGECIGYNLAYQAKNDMRIAILDIGYANGYPRSASNVGYVLINDKRANIVGNISMSLMAVDITDIECKPLVDSAVLLGRDAESEITISDIAQWSGRLDYEILTTIGKGVKRVYV
ncbi:MAG: alanine racemase [Firmicutes bacterium]|nr:alanine racemase [Bacillota bacterium]